MASNPCRPADRPRAYRGQDLINVATPAMQAALWTTAASAPERFVSGCIEAPLFYLSEWSDWFDFKHRHRFIAELIIVLAADAGIAEKPFRVLA